MKVAILAHIHFPIREPYAGGLEMHTRMMANELVKRGHDVTLFAKAGSQSDAKLVSIMPRIFVFRAYRFKVFHELQEVYMRLCEWYALLIIRLRHYDIVINNSLGPLPYTHLQDIPMLTILHTPATLEKVNKVIAPPWQSSPLHRYVSVSESNSIEWKKLLPDVDIVPNGIRLNDWSSTAKSKKGLAVWSGRITAEKGLDIAIKAVKLTGMRMKIAGPLYDEDYYTTIIVPLLDDDITYVGHIDHHNLARFYASGQVAISSPVWEEPFGLTTIEALAVGTPVAVLPHGAMGELITPKVGAISKNDTPKQLAKAIEKAKTLRRSDCKRYAKHYSIKKMVDHYEKIINDIQRGADQTAVHDNA